MTNFYEKEGIKYPRCTQIIGDCTDKSGALIQWGANCVVEWIRENSDAIEYEDAFGERFYAVTDEDLNKARFAYKTVSDKALDVGSEVHNAIEEVLKIQLLQIKQKYGGQLIPELSCEQAQNAYNAFLDWAQEHKLRPIELEKTVYGSRWAGTLDIVCEYDNKIFVIDWKTSKRFYMSEMGAQIAAYRSCVPEAEGCGILRLDKTTGQPEFKDFSKRYESDLRVFNAMVELYYLRHPRIRKRFENG